MPPARARNDPYRRAQDSLARLYALWVLSTLLLVLTLVILVFLGIARLNAIAERLSEQAQRLTRLERAVLQLESRAASISADRLSPALPVVPPETAPASSPPAGTRAPASAPAPALPGQPVLPSRPALPVVALDDEALVERLNALLPLSAPARDEIADASGADALLDAALAQAAHADWRGRTWTHLAWLAHLRERAADAEQFLNHAAAVGDTGAAYFELAGRRLLARGRAADAQALARRWAMTDRTDPRATLLRAEAELAGGSYGGAETAVAALADASALSPADQLRLGRVLIGLEDWPALAALLDRLGPVEDALAAERDFQRAVRRLQDRHFAEALAILDALAETRPDALEVQVWRGAVLVAANQLDAARAALDAAAQRDPADGQAAYHRGLLSLRSNDASLAREHLQAAIDRSPQLLAAWEALGIVELNAGNPAAAVERLMRAVELHPRRAPTHFLLALAHAKLARAEPAEAALKAAFALQPDLLEQAVASEALTRLIGPERIRALAGAAASGRPDEPSPPTSSTSAPATRPDGRGE